MDWLEASVRPSELGPRWIVVSERFAPRLLTRHQRELETASRKTKLGDESLTSLIEVGARVRPGDVLVGKVSPRYDAMLSPEEKLLRSISPEPDDMMDRSLRAPPGLEGVVVDSQYVEAEKGEIQRARVVVEWERSLQIGDELELEGGAKVTVAAISTIDTDVLYAGASGTLRLGKVRSALDVVHARSIGPYSLVTQQPLGGREQFGGQQVTEAQARALVAGGGRWLLAEMFTIKSDDVVGRVRAYESLVKRENPSPFAAPPQREGDIFSFFERPSGKRSAQRAERAETGARASPERDPKFGVAAVETAHVLQAELEALCFGMDWSTGKVELRWLDGDAILSRSRGEVKKPETINYRTFLPEDGGLFCSRIFGPVKDYECKCGKYKRMKNRGVICEKCGVEVIQSKVRRERFGHVSLAVPVLHPWFVAEAALLLDRPAEEVAKMRGDRLEPLLREVSLDAIEATSAGPRADLAEAMMARDLRPAALLLRSLPVLPPDLRPLVPLDGGRFATSDLNDLYRRVINRNNRLKRLIELNAPEIIIDNEILELGVAIATLFANGRKGIRKVKGPDGRPLVSLLGMIESRLDSGLLSKRADYSGVAMLVVDPTLDRSECRIPERMTREIFRPMAYGRMEAEGRVTTIKSAKQALEEGVDWALAAIDAESNGCPAILMCGPKIVSRRIRLWSEAAIAVDPTTALALGEAAEVAVHVPLTEEARAECAGFAARPTVVREPSGWFSRLVAGGDPVPGLVGAMLGGEVDPLDDPVLRIALGLRP